MSDCETSGGENAKIYQSGGSIIKAWLHVKKKKYIEMIYGEEEIRVDDDAEVDDKAELIEDGVD